MKIALASDHAGYDLKIGIAQFLEENNYAYHDFGSGPGEKVDYVDFGVKAAQGILSGDYDRGILICGTGIGMSITANKFRGIYAALCCDMFMAQMSRRHNNSNCLTLGGRILPLDKALHIVETWLKEDFEGDRHKRRVDKIAELEDINFKSE
ncbi:MAG: ribose 5-phosphate isomerase B [Candidatus Aminicenantaceae bacterium]